jgi:hypothetical protein
MVLYSNLHLPRVAGSFMYVCVTAQGADTMPIGMLVALTNERLGEVYYMVTGLHNMARL